MAAPRIETAITVWAASVATAVLSSLSTRIECLRRSLIVALRVVLSASTGGIWSIAAS
jgi:hypothetical protein